MLSLWIKIFFLPLRGGRFSPVLQARCGSSVPRFTQERWDSIFPTFQTERRVPVFIISMRWVGGFSDRAQLVKCSLRKRQHLSSDGPQNHCGEPRTGSVNPHQEWRQRQGDLQCSPAGKSGRMDEFQVQGNSISKIKVESNRGRHPSCLLISHPHPPLPAHTHARTHARKHFDYIRCSSSSLLRHLLYFSLVHVFILKIT